MIVDPARQALEASTAWWELITTIAGFVTAFLTVVAAGFSSWYFIQNRRIASGSLHHVAAAKRRRDILETAAIVATAAAAAAGLVAGSSALLYFSRNRLLQAIQQRESSAVAETASQALKEQVGLKRENAALNSQVVGLQQDQLRLSSETARAYHDLYDAKAKISELDREQRPRAISRGQATKMRSILSPYASLGSGVKRRAIFTSSADNVETQDFAKQLSEVFLSAGWDARLTPSVLEFSISGTRSSEGLTLELLDRTDPSGVVAAVTAALRVVDPKTGADYNPSREPGIIAVRVAAKRLRQRPENDRFSNPSTYSTPAQSPRFSPPHP